MDGLLHFMFDRSTLVNGITCDVHDTAECASSYRNHDGRASVCSLCTSNETFGTCRALY